MMESHEERTLTSRNEPIHEHQLVNDELLQQSTVSHTVRRRDSGRIRENSVFHRDLRTSSQYHRVDGSPNPSRGNETMTSKSRSPSAGLKFRRLTSKNHSLRKQHTNKEEHCDSPSIESHSIRDSKPMILRRLPLTYELAFYVAIESCASTRENWDAVIKAFADFSQTDQVRIMPMTTVCDCSLLKRRKVMNVIET